MSELEMSYTVVVVVFVVAFNMAHCLPTSTTKPCSGNDDREGEAT
jgi:hypothetical protein